MRLDIIQNSDEFSALREEWDGLLAESSSDSPFLRHDRLAAWWEVFGQEAGLRVITCREEGGRLVGVAPLYLRREGTRARARVLRLMGDEGIGAAGLTPFTAPGMEDEVLARLAKQIRADAGRYDVLDLNYMDPTAPFFATAESFPRTRTIPTSDLCPRISLPGDWDSYLKLLSQNMRHNAKRTLRRIQERGIELEMIEDPDSLPEAIDDLVRLQSARLRQKFGEDYAMPYTYQAFTERTLPVSLAEGRLRLLFFRHDGRRLAVFHAFRYGDTMYADRTGFDDDTPAQNILRPLWATAIRLAIEEGCAVMDTMNGNFSYKSDWAATDLRRLSRVRSYALTPMGLARSAHDAVAAKRKARSRPSR